MSDPATKLTELQRQIDELRADRDRKEEAIRKLLEDSGEAIRPEDLAASIPGEVWMAEFLANLESGKVPS